MIYIGADHGGFHLKEKIKKWLGEWELKYQDLGNDKLDPDDDEPVFAFLVAEKVSQNDDMTKVWKDRPKGILICRSGAGMEIAANKIADIRAATLLNAEVAKHAREHNDVNVISLAGDWLKDDDAKEILRVWLNTEFSGKARYKRRIDQIREKEYGGCCGGGCGKC